MKIILLTHEREINRKTNTGNIALKLLPELVERIVWERKQPNSKLLKLIDLGSTILLQPSKNTEPLTNIDFENIIIIDATWQEAKKIYNHSPYLNTIETAVLNSKTTSQYLLRRNQPNGGLCTIECIIEILKLKNENQLATKLKFIFDAFNDNK